MYSTDQMNPPDEGASANGAVLRECYACTKKDKSSQPVFQRRICPLLLHNWFVFVIM